MFGPELLVDKFNRADENPLSDGGAWTNGLSGQGVADLQVLGNAVTEVGDSAFAQRTVGSSADHEAYYTITVLSAVSVNFSVGLRGQGSGAAIDTYDVSMTSDTGAWLLRIIVDLVATTIASGTLSQGALVAGDAIGIRAIGNRIAAYFKPVGGLWSELGAAIDSTITTTGFFSISTDVVGSSTPDTTLRIDDFGGGNSVEGGGPVDDRYRAAHTRRTSYSAASRILTNAIWADAAMDFGQRDRVADNLSRII